MSIDIKLFRELLNPSETLNFLLHVTRNSKSIQHVR